jgi:tectonin-like protein
MNLRMQFWATILSLKKRSQRETIRSGGGIVFLAAAAGLLVAAGPTYRGWHKYPGCAKDIAVGSNGTVWATGCGSVLGGHPIYRWKGSERWIFQPWLGSGWEQLRASGVRIAAAGNLAWLVNDQGSIYFGDTEHTDWHNYPGCARDIAVSPDGGVWIISCSAVPGGYSVDHTVGDVLQPLRLIPSGGVHIAAEPGGRLWLVNDEGAIYRGREGAPWERVPGCARNIAVGSNGAVWIVGCDRVSGGWSVQRWTNRAWQRVEGGATNIAVADDGTPWIVNDVGTVYRRETP